MKCVVRGLILALIPAFALASSSVDTISDGPQGWSAPPYWSPQPEVSPGNVDQSARTALAAGRQTLATSPLPLPFVAVAPCRMVDTRGNGAPLTGGFLPAATTRSYTLTGICNIPANAQAISLNATVVNPIGPGFLVLWPQGGAFPPVSTLNFVVGQTVANAAIVPLSVSGGVSLAFGVSGGDVILDTNGYYSPLGVVNSLNGQGGDLTLVAGTNVTITPAGTTLTINAASGTGPAGPAGPAGPTGPTGGAGSQGPIGLTGATGTKGDPGLTGATGPQGIQGNQGATGNQGNQGFQGIPGAQGPTGAQGATGPQGVPGADAVYVGVNWGVIDRNTIGSPVAVLRAGPFGSFGVTDNPPKGIGSLGLEVADPTAKISFGNEVDFYNMNVSSLTAVGFNVFTTGENSLLGIPNMPSITFEINPAGAGATTTGYSSLVFMPAANSTSNRWSVYIDATTSGFWGLTGTQFNSPATQANCGLNGPRCTFAQVQTFLATGTGAKIYSIAVTKGRDFAWQGAVDGLRINATIYDFEPLGVRAVPAP